MPKKHERHNKLASPKNKPEENDQSRRVCFKPIQTILGTGSAAAGSEAATSLVKVAGVSAKGE
jgi:hypothetical protein